VEINNKKYITYTSHMILKIGIGEKYKEIKTFISNSADACHARKEHINTKQVGQYVVKKVFYVLHVGIN
jgi:hypothetical protein